MFEQEIWKDIPEYEGLYQVSNYGNVKGIKRRKNLNPSKNNNGYFYVILSKNGVTKHFYIHRLVAITFIENPENLLEVNHKDENKLNNKLENLEWCNCEYNLNYGNCQLKKSKSNQKKVAQYDLLGNLIAIFNSIKEAKKYIAIKGSQISKCCKNKRRYAGGYMWKYYDNN